MQPEARRLYIRAQMYIPPTRANSRPNCAPAGGGVKKSLVGVGARTLSRARHLCCRGGSLLFVCPRNEPVCSFPFIHLVLAVFWSSLRCTECRKRSQNKIPIKPYHRNPVIPPSMLITNILSKFHHQPGAGAKPLAPEAPRPQPQPLQPY